MPPLRYRRSARPGSETIADPFYALIAVKISMGAEDPQSVVAAHGDELVGSTIDAV